MACQPSRTFRLVASSTSKAGTICPAAMASIFSDPEVSFSRRSAKILKCSCSVMLAGQVDCIFRVRGAGACAWLPGLIPAANANQTATASARLSIIISPWLVGRQTAYGKCSPPWASMTGKGDRHGQGLPDHLLPLDQESRDARRLREDRRPRDAGGGRALPRTRHARKNLRERAQPAHGGGGIRQPRARHRRARRPRLPGSAGRARQRRRARRAPRRRRQLTWTGEDLSVLWRLARFL